MLEDAHGQHFTAQFVVPGMGALSTAAIPQLNGIENFKGPMFHSQQWNHDYDLKDKRVAVIGTGASAIQAGAAAAKAGRPARFYQCTAPDHAQT